MNYEGILEFHGTWRSYQARVLQNVSRYLSDDKIHISSTVLLTCSTFLQV